MYQKRTKAFLEKENERLTRERNQAIRQRDEAREAVLRMREKTDELLFLETSFVKMLEKRE